MFSRYTSSRNGGIIVTNEGGEAPGREERAMKVIRVKCYNQFTNEDVYKHFDWHEESGRLCEVSGDSIYAAGICEVEGEVIFHAVDLCKKHGLNVLSYQSWEE